jgi:membrane-associated phospholipid phosphatase
MSVIDARLRRRLIIAFLVVLLFCAVSYVWLDRPVALWFKANLHGTWSDIFHRLTDLGLGGVWLVPAGIGAILFRWVEIRARRGARAGWSVERWHLHANAALFLFVSVAASGLVVDLLKGLIGRLRPYELFVHNAYGFVPFSIHWNMNSFPSGHGQTIVAAMTALAAIWPRGRALWYLLAVAVAASRVIISVHYLSDVVMGCYCGALGTILLARLFAARGWKIDVSGT